MSISSLSEEQQLANAKAMGDGFADQRGMDLIKLFLCETGIVDEAYDVHKDIAEKPLEPARFLELLAKDYIIPFKKMMSTCYGIGFMDAKQNVSTMVYRPSSSKIERGGLIV